MVTANSRVARRLLCLKCFVFHFFFYAAHAAVVTCAIFAPCPDVIIRSQSNFMADSDEDDDDSSGVGVGQGEVIVSADYSGIIRVFLNKFKPD